MKNKEIIQELEQVAPLLNTIAKTPVQTVPTGYFDHFQVPIQMEETKVVQMNPGRKWFTLAAAAVVIGVLVIGGFNLVNQSTVKTSPVLVINMEQIAKMDIDKSVQALSNDAIDEYLKTANALAGPENSLHQYTVDAISETTVAEISDEELQLYLSE
ncbi:MAG: hypothetical protein B7Y37_05180 [Sphingobacteriia bacterium 28-36-52]|nr:MAG: hypothetical protein B7Z27_03790 [Sphingobacteriia bacterium 32-37-4]OYZ01991.1 MAG: hypothetical protein B7Y37_05180 [Sphingobacteriia bacterium 28-36-52]